MALLLLLPALAGCTAEAPVLEGQPYNPVPAAPAALGPGAVPGEANATGDVSFDAPASWDVRWWWRYRVTDDGAGRVDTRVVTADIGSAWFVDTDSPDTAYFDALFDVSSLGRIRKADLAGDQRGQTVEYFRWPLVANSTWSTLWDGRQRAITVLGPTQASVGGKTYPAMALQASENNAVTVRYNYVPAVGWWSFTDFSGPGGSFRTELAEWGTDYNGTIAQARVQEVYRDAADGPLKPQGTFTVEAGATFLDVQGLFTGDVVHYFVGFRAPDGALYNYTGSPCTANCSVPFSAELNATSGPWGLATATLVQSGQTRTAHSELVVRAVTIAHRKVA